MNQKADHLLKTIWLVNQRCLIDSETVHEQLSPGPKEVIDALVAEGFIVRENGTLKLLPRGQAKAESLIRRHLLAERLLTDILQVSEEETVRSACAFEHILSPEVTDSVCTFLGHPPVCPHGVAIPKGPCCTKLTGQVKPVVHSLQQMELGEKARIVFIVPDQNSTLDRLAVFGVQPGNSIKLIQKSPAFVIEIDGTVLALEAALGKSVYVNSITTSEE